MLDVLPRQNRSDLQDVGGGKSHCFHFFPQNATLRPAQEPVKLATMVVFGRFSDAVKCNSRNIP
jgi:hypothetical protein